jgi:hypothetical protein
MTSIAAGPNGDVCLAGDEVLRPRWGRRACHGHLTRFDLWVRCLGVPKSASLNTLTSIAVNARGDIFTTEPNCRQLLEITNSGVLKDLGNDRGYEGGPEEIAGTGNQLALWGYRSNRLVDDQPSPVKPFATAAAVWSRGAGILGESTSESINDCAPGSLAVDEDDDVFLATDPSGSSSVGAIAEVTFLGKVELVWKSPPD